MFGGFRNSYQVQMERPKQKERTAKLDQRSKASAEWDYSPWRADTVPLQLIAVEMKVHLAVWKQEVDLVVEEYCQNSQAWEKRSHLIVTIYFGARSMHAV